MAKPAGFSSDEDDLYDDYYSEPCYKQVDSKQYVCNNELDLKLKRNNNLYLSIVNSRVEDALDILNDDIDVNQVLNGDWTPLMLAASVGCKEIVEKLIDLGADINAEKDKYTILMAACACPEACAPFPNSLEVVKLLINKGANVNLQDRTRMTALTYAAKIGNLDVVNFLLPICDKYAEDNQGWNALFWAASTNKPLVVAKLLDEHFPVDKIDVRNNTSLFYATMNGYEEIINLFPSEKAKEPILLDANTYDLEETLNVNFRPTFFKDITLLLHGMKSESLIKLFQEKNVDLLQFLALTENELVDLGINTPFQRHRILTGLYKFHKYPFKKKSVPIVQKEKPYSTLDLSHTILTAVRQITVLEAALLYLSKQVHLNKIGTQQKEIELINEQLKKIKNTCQKVRKFTQNFDTGRKSADLIVYQSKRRQYKNKYFHWSYGVVILGCALLMIHKIKLSPKFHW